MRRSRGFEIKLFSFQSPAEGLVWPLVLLTSEIPRPNVSSMYSTRLKGTSIRGTSVRQPAPDSRPPPGHLSYTSRIVTWYKAGFPNLTYGKGVGAPL